MVFPEASEQRAAELGVRFEAWLLQRMELGAGEAQVVLPACRLPPASAAPYAPLLRSPRPAWSASAPQPRHNLGKASAKPR